MAILNAYRGLMVDDKTGESWVLERMNLVPTNQVASLYRKADFCSPTGDCYYWVPTAFLPRYKETLGIGCNPDEARKADEDALLLWKNQMEINSERKEKLKKLFDPESLYHPNPLDFYTF